MFATGARRGKAGNDKIRLSYLAVATRVEHARIADARRESSSSLVLVLVLGAKAIPNRGQSDALQPPAFILPHRNNPADRSE